MPSLKLGSVTKGTLMNNYPSECIDSAKHVFDYLNLYETALCSADLIMGFGHFDTKIPLHCADLYKKGLAKKILFTGGRGAGSVDLREPEGIAFKNALKGSYSFVDINDVLVESASTNTAENILFSNETLKKAGLGITLDQGLKGVIVVASPYRQRRVWLTMRKFCPGVSIQNSPPPATFEQEFELFAMKNENLILLMLGEVDRLREYPAKGFIAFEEIPAEIESACSELRQELHRLV